MTTSIQMAQECLKQDPTLAETQDKGQSFEGLEAFAQTIESGIIAFYLIALRDYLNYFTKCFRRRLQKDQKVACRRLQMLNAFEH